MGDFFKKIFKHIVIFYSKSLHPRFEMFRQLFLKIKLKEYGHGVYIHKYVIIENANKVSLGHHVNIASFVHIWGGGGVKIGNYVLIGSHTSLASESHDYTQNIMYNTYKNSEIIIGDNVWIGSHCVIMPGVSIGDGSVIGAGSIVTKDVEPGAIVFGIPAKLYKNRLNGIS